MTKKRLAYHALVTEEDKLAFRQRAVSSFLSDGETSDPATWPGYHYCDWEGLMRARETCALSIFFPRLTRWVFALRKPHRLNGSG